ncbi:MAG: hypothetical protein DHS20C15_15300 [Planctomycetota bacterium]|nr:MAG: hypothetical protein DHS20C15_15300 [Planctomycetota bacterium]
MRAFFRGIVCGALGLVGACTEPDAEHDVHSAVPAVPGDDATLHAAALQSVSPEEVAAARARWPADLLAIVKRAEREFDVPTVSVLAFDALPEGTVLFDVRTSAEASVSSIPSAHLLADEHARQALLDAPPSGPVVVSCAAGWRSARFTQALRAKGVEAYNLEGGLFAWVAAGRTILDPDGRATKRVHTYNKDWASSLPTDHEVVLEPKP